VHGPWQTARAHDELLAAVSFAPWPAGTASTYVKFGVHERPTLGVAVALQMDGARIDTARVTFGCVNPQPARVTAAETRLSGMALADVADVTADVGTMAADMVDAVDDLHGSADYKREMVAVFTRRALGVAAARARGAAAPVRYPYTVVA
jgi:carbon-monoxide dehydrogenase medium subunit